MISIVDGAARFLAETGVDFGMVKVEFLKVKELELVEGETEFPRDVCTPDGEDIVVWSSEGHGVVVK